jgi:hypothetical protein
VLALIVAAPAAAAPPANDNRVDAADIPAFPSAIAGTTVEATVERLDPQVSKCGPIEGTVWYRISPAPDGTLTFAVQGEGLMPVIRIYSMAKTGITELSCGAAGLGKAASASFVARRGDSYLVVVGKKPGTADAAFTLQATQTLPPPNDDQGQATRVPKIPATLTGTTVAATANGDTDTAECGLGGGGSVWYALDPAGETRVLLKLRVAAGIDAGLAVFEKTRSQVEEIGCQKTDRNGGLSVAFDTTKGSTYLIMVGTRKGSAAGEFVLDATRAEPRETAPGQALGTTGVPGTVDWISDPNDVYSTTLEAGTTYRIAFVSDGAVLTVTGHGEKLLTFEGKGYRTVTPGPASAGRYVFDVSAPDDTGTFGYDLVVKPAEADDTGAGLALSLGVPVNGSIAPAAADVVDVYHFVVTTDRTNIRITLDTPKKSGVSAVVTGPDGEKVGTLVKQLERPLAAGRYLLTVQGTLGKKASDYTVAFAVRQRTVATIRAPRGELPSNVPADIHVALNPAPTTGVIVVRIERYDETDGWVFAKAITVSVPGGPVQWEPPTPGRWRVSARYDGSLSFSASRTKVHAFTVVRARELAPGTPLAKAGVMQRVDWARDVNDVWWKQVEPGVTYLVAFTSTGARATLTLPDGSTVAMSGNGFRVLTPGPGQGGKVVVDVTAPEDRGAIPYRLVVKPAGADDIGLGTPFRNLEIVRGTLDPAAADVVDLYRFTLKDTTSDVRLRLASERGSGIAIRVLSPGGREIGSSATVIKRGLPAGTYIVAVRGAMGKPGGAYTLRLIARHYTTTTVSLASPTVRFGSAVSMRVTVEPRPSAGTLEVRVDRYDPSLGWVYARTLGVAPTGGWVSWTPTLPGQYRLKATYSGSIEHTPSASPTVTVDVTDALR